MHKGQHGEADARGEQHRARGVGQARGGSGRNVFDDQRDDGERDKSERQVDPERPTPAAGIDQETAERWPGRRADRADRHLRRDGDATLCDGELAVEERSAARDDQRRAECLAGSASDEQCHTGRQRSGDGRRGEEAGAGEQRELVAPPLGERRAEHQRGRSDDGEDVDRPRQRGRRRAWEVAFEIRKYHECHRERHGHLEVGESHRREHGPRPSHRLVLGLDGGHQSETIRTDGGHCAKVAPWTVCGSTFGFGRCGSPPRAPSRLTCAAPSASWSTAPGQRPRPR